jgi:hypothetical protein
MTVLDLDLDFFLGDVPYRSFGGRPSADEFPPWDRHKVRAFLERRCGLSRDRRVKGRLVRQHHEAFFFWRELIGAGRLECPFHVVHVDSHADLGMGDSGYVYLLTEILQRPVEQRPSPEVGSDKLTEGNYLAFAVGCRWIRSIRYVAHPKAGDDLMPILFKDFDKQTATLHLRPLTEGQIEAYFDRLSPRQLPAQPTCEPEVPFVKTPGDRFRTSEPFDFAVLCQSPSYTPPEADGLIPTILEYIEPV